MKIILLLVYMALSLAGCAMGGISTISEPYIKDTSDEIIFKNGVLYKDRISISIIPENGYGNIGGIGILVPIVPIPGSGKPYRTEKPFQVELRLETFVEGYSYMPSETIIYYESEAVLPTSSTPLDTRISQTRSENAYIPAHPWSCGRPLSGFFEQNINKPMSLSKGCLWLEFPVRTIHPSQPFSIALNGLRFNGKSIDIPRIFFREDKRGMYSLMGSP